MGLLLGFMGKPAAGLVSSLKINELATLLGNEEAGGLRLISSLSCNCLPSLTLKSIYWHIKTYDN